MKTSALENPIWSAPYYYKDMAPMSDASAIKVALSASSRCVLSVLEVQVADNISLRSPGQTGQSSLIIAVYGSRLPIGHSDEVLIGWEIPTKAIARLVMVGLGTILIFRGDTTRLSCLQRRTFYNTSFKSTIIVLRGPPQYA